MKFEWPQTIYMLLVAFNLLIESNRHGKAKTGKHDFWNSLIATPIGLALMYFGGFFTK